MNATLATPDHTADTPAAPLLQIDELSMSFGQKTVLNGVSLTLPPGEVLGLLGKNGAGKSTLLKCALGLLRPTGGRATVLGDDAWSLSAEAKGRLGYVPQEVVAYPWMRVRQVVAYTAAFYPSWNPALAADLCERWSLPMNDRAGVLSVGQLQSLGLVLALGHEPDLLVLDEPVASLDPLARRQFLRTLIDIVDESNQAGGRRRSVLFSTHITSDLERIADRIALVQRGKLTLEGSLGELKDRVKRLRLTSRGAAFDDRLAIAGAARLVIDGHVAEATVTDFADDTVDYLSQRHDADVEVIDLNLEEMFVDLHEG
ncbi:MAG: ABC transporter ATP-binding protein [Planctomycetota bacterium]